MRVSRFYFPTPIGQLKELVMPDKLAHYMRTVLRLKANDEVILFDGSGHDFQGVITVCNKKTVEVTLHNQTAIHKESPISIHLGQGPCRGEKMDWVIQKSVELGVAAITPIQCEFGNVKLSGDRLTQKQQHWQQVAVSACEQSGRGIIPTVHPVMSFAQWTEQVDAELKLLLHPGEHNGLPASSLTKGIACAVGPEGGFSEDEVMQAQAQGFHAIALGPRILRTETAPIAMLSVLQAQFGDF